MGVHVVESSLYHSVSHSPETGSLTEPKFTVYTMLAGERSWDLPILSLPPPQLVLGLQILHPCPVFTWVLGI